MIYHITHQNGGGTEKHINELIKLFPNENHTVINTSPFTIENIDKVKLIHIHSTMFGKHIGWNVLQIIDFFNKKRKQVYLTIHDYQWILAKSPAVSTEELETIIPREEDVSNCTLLLNKVDKIIIPTMRVFENYKRFIKDIPEHNVYVVPHCDIPIRMEQLYVPRINNTINIAFIGLPLEHKGFFKFHELTLAMDNYYETPINYYVYGCKFETDKQNIISRGEYRDDTLIEELHKDCIHIVLSISMAEETYCYSLSKLINSGLPIVYFNRGSLTTRLTQSPRFFPVNSSSTYELQRQVVKAIRYVQSEPVNDYVPQSEEPELNNFYKKNYIPV